MSGCFLGSDQPVLLLSSFPGSVTQFLISLFGVVGVFCMNLIPGQHYPSFMEEGLFHCHFISTAQIQVS